MSRLWSLDYTSSSLVALLPSSDRERYELIDRTFASSKAPIQLSSVTDTSNHYLHCAAGCITFDIEAWLVPAQSSGAAAVGEVLERL